MSNMTETTNTGRTITVAEEREEFMLGWIVLGFAIPLVGLVLYLAWREYRPLAARSAGKGALASVALGLVVAILGSLGVF